MCGLINRALLFFSSPPLSLSHSLRRSVSFGFASFPSSPLSSIFIFFPSWLASSDFVLLFLTSIFYQSYQSTSYHDQYWARDAVSHSRSYLYASPIYVYSAHPPLATLCHVHSWSAAPAVLLLTLMLLTNNWRLLCIVSQQHSLVPRWSSERHKGLVG